MSNEKFNRVKIPYIAVKNGLGRDVSSKKRSPATLSTKTIIASIVNDSLKVSSEVFCGAPKKPITKVAKVAVMEITEAKEHKGSFTSVSSHTIQNVAAQAAKETIMQQHVIKNTVLSFIIQKFGE